MKIPFIDLKAQYLAIKEQVDKRIANVLDHGAFINGPEVSELEKNLAEFTGAKYAIACSNGTDALLIPLMAMGIKPGDEVITTAFSFIATAEVIMLMGATPVYADIDPKTYNLSISSVEKLITPKTKAIMPVSLYGLMPDLEALMSLADRHKLFIIEDAAQSFGGKLNDKTSCSIAHASGTSFFPAKPLGCYGDGGAIFTNDEKMMVKMKEIREHGSEKRYYHTSIGLNARLDTLQCAILLAKLERYPYEIKRRQELAEKYNRAFKELNNFGITTPLTPSGHQSVWAQYTLRSNKRDAFQSELTKLEVPTSIHYPRIMPDQPAYAHTANPKHDYSESRRAASEVISLPLYPDMTEDIQNEIIKRVFTAAKALVP